jgi:hypothetical protein
MSCIQHQICDELAPDKIYSAISINIHREKSETKPRCGNVDCEENYIQIFFKHKFTKT